MEKSKGVDMALDEQKILELIVHQGMFARQFQELRSLMEADDELVSQITGPRDFYSERATRAFAQEVAHAYTLYANVVGRVDGPDPLENARVALAETQMLAGGNSEGSADSAAKSAGIPEAGDGVESADAASRMQAAFDDMLPLMVYCLVRLVADSPFFAGTLGELKLACSEFAKSLSLGVRGQAVQAWETLQRECGAQPRTPEDLAKSYLPEFGGYVGTYSDVVWDGPASGLYNEFPSLSALDEDADEYGAGVTSEGQVTKEWLFADLNCVYEMLSGKLVPAAPPSPTGDAFKPDESVARHMLQYLDEDQARRAWELGWIEKDELDSRIADLDPHFERWFEEEYGSDGFSVEEKEQIIAEAIEEQRAEREGRLQRQAERFASSRTQRALAALRKWVETFSEKDAWCESYLALRQAYFRLCDAWEALDPVERYETVRPSIDDDVLRGALEASINERGLSHFNDETFTKVSGLLYRCADIARDGSAGARRLR